MATAAAAADAECGGWVNDWSDRLAEELTRMGLLMPGAGLGRPEKAAVGMAKKEASKAKGDKQEAAAPVAGVGPAVLKWNIPFRR